MKKLGPRSTLLRRGSIDGRSREGKFLREYEARLLDHVGDPSPTQAALIRQLAMLALRIELMNLKDGPTGILSADDGKRYLAWSNSLVRGLTALGLDKRPVKPPSIAELIASTKAA